MTSHTPAASRKGLYSQLNPSATSFDDALLSPNPALFEPLAPLPISTSAGHATARTAPLPAARLKDAGPELRKSRSSLFSLFDRSNAEVSPVWSQSPISSHVDELSPRHSQKRKLDARTIPAKVVNVNTSVPYHSPPPPPPPRRPSAPTSSSVRPKAIKRSKPVEARLQSPWDPPPLFQAYPQALRHSSLPDPEVVLAAHSSAESSPSRDKDKPDSSKKKTTTSGKRFGRGQPRKAAQPVPSRSRGAAFPLGSRKIYVLVTSARLLQYAGDGPYDRLPEKILKLRKESAALPSDVMSGKHWAMQVLEDGQKPRSQQRSLLSRLGLRSVAARLTAPGLLLVFDSSEEMNDWMTAIREEVENLGGQPVREQVRERKSSDASVDKSPITHRYMMITRNPSLSTNLLPMMAPEEAMSSPTLVGSERESSSTAVGTSSGWSSNRSSIQNFSRRLSSLQKLSITTAIYSEPELSEDVSTSPHATELPLPPLSTWSEDRNMKDIQSLDSSSRAFHQRNERTSDSRRTLLPPVSPTEKDEHDGERSPTHLPRHSSFKNSAPNTQPRQYQPSSITNGYRSWSSSSGSLRQSTTASRLPRLYITPSSTGISPSCMESISENLPYVEHVKEEPNLTSGIQSNASSACNNEAFKNTLRSVESHPAIGSTETTSTLSVRTSIVPISSATSGTPSVVSSARTSLRPTTNHLFRASSSNSYPLYLDSEASVSSTPRTSARSSSSTLQFRTSLRLPPSPTYLPNSPNSPSTGALSNPLKRPACLQVNTDPAPFVSSVRAGARSPSGIRSSPSSSILVPIVRPAMIKPALRARQSAPLLNLPPPSRPPSVPLPLPPIQLAV